MLCRLSLISVGLFKTGLALTDSEHLGATGRADALGCWLAILHSYRLGILHLFLGTTFNTICLHNFLPCDSGIETNLF